MRFRSQLSNIGTFAKFTASLSSLGKICWMRLEDEVVRFTIIPDQGTQVWAQLPIDAIFDETYTVQSATGVINLEVPIGALSRALRSAIGANSAQLRLTKKGAVPLLALTVVASSWTAGNNALGIESSEAPGLGGAVPGPDDDRQSQTAAPAGRRGGGGPRERETVITQEIPVKVLHQSVVEGLHEPRCRDPDVHIILPSLAQLKAISDRFTKLAMSSTGASGSGGRSGGGASLSSSTLGPKLELSANMHGSLKLAIATDALRISSVWTGLVNPPLDPNQLSQTEIEQLPSERMRALGAQANGDEEAGWAKVRIDGKDWGRVLSVGRLSPKVVACFIHETALILYVYLRGGWSGEESCLTYYINSYAT
ncbi:hypothetical protein VTN77DRAFT_5428 [Rasamsonia byssochlamydoides]|uniref:uncharacterized protein n=1 Tax=Rasamsonia byssochlamydoides TaxID=89139 RepID=UPI003742E6D1